MGTGEFLKSGCVGAPDVTGAVIAAVIVAADVDDAVVVITCGEEIFCVISSSSEESKNLCNFNINVLHVYLHWCKVLTVVHDRV